MMAAEPEDHPLSAVDHPRPLLLAGPTAAGKSAIAIELAERLAGEIVSVDSMQVYRGMDIGTAKPSAADRARVLHHLIDVVDLKESFDAAHFVRLASKTVSDIQARGRVAILCGGTGLYFKAFLKGLGQAPPADPALRAALEATPLPKLLAELSASDPATYERIDRQNPRRVIRAVEVIRLTGKPFSAQRANWVHAPPVLRSSTAEGGRTTHHASTSFGICRAPADLRKRIDARVDAMFCHGWVAETEQLLAHGLAEHRTAMQALGYRQIVEHLRGERSLAETIELVKTRTRQFAKRQLTWFRRQLELTWINLEPQSTADEVVRHIAAIARQGNSTTDEHR